MIMFRFAKCAVAVGAIGLAAVLPSNAQAANTTATAAATIAAAIGIANSANMSFGIIAPDPVNPGTVVLVPAGTRTNPDGFLTLIGGGTVAAAAFDVNGGANATYTITLPAGPVSLIKGVDSMTATGFNDSLTGAGTLDGTGAQSFTVGATLNVTAAQPVGDYISAGFTVTVNYN